LYPALIVVLAVATTKLEMTMPTKTEIELLNELRVDLLNLLYDDPVKLRSRVEDMLDYTRKYLEENHKVCGTCTEYASYGCAKYNEDADPNDKGCDSWEIL
jgi:hypothetical protein